MVFAIYPAHMDNRWTVKMKTIFYMLLTSALLMVTTGVLADNTLGGVSISEPPAFMLILLGFLGLIFSRRKFN